MQKNNSFNTFPSFVAFKIPELLQKESVLTYWLLTMGGKFSNKCDVFGPIYFEFVRTGYFITEG